MTERPRVLEIDDEGRRLVRIIRRGTRAVVTWRRAQMVLLPAQGMDVELPPGAASDLIDPGLTSGMIRAALVKNSLLLGNVGMS